MSDIVLSQSFALLTCYKCGCAFAVPQHFRNKRHEDGQSFFCPNGHPQAFVVSTEDRLRAELVEKERLLSQANNRTADAQDRLLKAERAKKRLEKRVAAGVCPFPGCKRHFTNLHRHVETEHHGQVLPALSGVAEQKLLQ